MPYVVGRSDTQVLVAESDKGVIIDVDFGIIVESGSYEELYKTRKWEKTTFQPSEDTLALVASALEVANSAKAVIASAGERLYTIPKAAQVEARKALEWHKKHHRGGTPVGMNTARTLAEGGQIGIEKVRHIAKYFPRHEVDKKGKGWKPGEDNFPSNGRIAWALWGGDAAWRWAADIVESDNNRKKALKASGFSEIESVFSDGLNPLDAFKEAYESDIVDAPEFLARVRLDGSGIDRLYKIDVTGQVYVWDDGVWEDLGQIDGDIWTYDKSLDDPYDRVEKSHIGIDPESAIQIAARLEQAPHKCVSVFDLDANEASMMAENFDAIDWSLIDGAVTAAGPADSVSLKSTVKNDGQYTQEERSQNATRQSRDATGKFIQSGGRVSIANNPNVQGKVQGKNDDGTISVQLDNGKSVNLDPKLVKNVGPNDKAGTLQPSVVAQDFQSPLDVSGILGEPRTPIDQPEAHLPGTLPPMTSADLHDVLNNWDSWVQEQRDNYIPVSKQQVIDFGRRKYPGQKVKDDWATPVVSAAEAPASTEPAKELTPETSDVKPFYMAVVAPDDPRAVLDLISLVPASSKDPAPMVYRRTDGKWERNEQMLNDLKSATPPPVVPLDEDVLQDVLKQVDGITASAFMDQAFMVLWGPNPEVMSIVAAGGADRSRGNAEKLRRYWVSGPGAAKIRWGAGGDWKRCVRHLSKYLGVRAKGYCQLRHKEALGIYTSTHAKKLGGPHRGRNNSVESVEFIMEEVLTKNYGIPTEVTEKDMLIPVEKIMSEKDDLYDHHWEPEDAIVEACRELAKCGDEEFDALTAAGGFGNMSRAERSAKAKRQLRDKHGRWIEMGHLVKVDLPHGASARGKMAGAKDAETAFIDVADGGGLPKGRYEIKTSAISNIVATLPSSNSENRQKQKALANPGIKLGNSKESPSFGRIDAAVDHILDGVVKRPTGEKYSSGSLLEISARYGVDPEELKRRAKNLNSDIKDTGFGNNPKPMEDYIKQGAISLGWDWKESGKSGKPSVPKEAFKALAEYSGLSEDEVENIYNSQGVGVEKPNQKALANPGIKLGYSKGSSSDRDMDAALDYVLDGAVKRPNGAKFDSASLLTIAASHGVDPEELKRRAKNLNSDIEDTGFMENKFFTPADYIDSGAESFNYNWGHSDKGGNPFISEKAIKPLAKYAGISEDEVKRIYNAKGVGVGKPLTKEEYKNATIEDLIREIRTGSGEIHRGIDYVANKLDMDPEDVADILISRGISLSTNTTIIAAGGLDQNRGNAEELRHYWTVGKGGLKIRWGTKGDWTRCVRNLEKYLGPRAKGYCALRHKEMNGVWPGDKNNRQVYGRRAGRAVFSNELLNATNHVIELATREARILDAKDRIKGIAASGLEECGAKFSIPLVIPEGVESGDGRKFRKGSITMRELPLPLLWQIKTADGHQGSVVVGRIDRMERIDGGIGNAYGVFDTGHYGQEAERLVRNGFIRGVSADMDKFEAEETKPEAADGESEVKKDKLVINKARIMAATIVPKPAFQECRIFLSEEETPQEEIVIPDGVYAEDVDPADAAAIVACGLVAGSIPVVPPTEWFDNPKLNKPTPLTITEDGQVFGHVAAWNVDHIGMAYGTKPPRSKSKYSYFHTGVIRTSDGTDVPVGQLTLAGGHAPLSASASEAAKHYDDTASAFADVHAGEDSYGIWVAGSLRPGVTPEQVRAARASAPSGDWRPIRGSLELVAVCQVNVPGFPIARAMVSSGQVMALVAAGAQTLAKMKSDPLTDLNARLARLEEFTTLELNTKAESAKALFAEVKAQRNSELSARAEELSARLDAVFSYEDDFSYISRRERKDLAEKGQALPDGSFPIRNVEDLKNAIHSYGRASEGSRASVQKHIMKRARQLGQTKVVPQKWKEASNAELDAITASIRDRAAEFAVTELSKISEEERKDLAKKGQALPDGSFPIRNVSDLKNAIHAYGRASEADRAKVRTHIRKRAKALGQEKLVPENWKAASISEFSIVAAAPVLAPVLDENGEPMLDKNGNPIIGQQPEPQVQPAAEADAPKKAEAAEPAAPEGEVVDNPEVIDVVDKSAEGGHVVDGKYIPGKTQPRDEAGKFRKVLARLKQDLGTAGLQKIAEEAKTVEGLHEIGNYAEAAKSANELIDTVDRLDSGALNKVSLENVRSSARELGKVIANLPLGFNDQSEKLRYSDLPPALQNLMEEMITRVEDKIGKKDAAIATESLQGFKSGSDVYSQAEISSQMSKLLRLLT